MENNGLKAYTEELLKQGGYATEDGYGLRIPQLQEDVNALKPELIALLLSDEKTRAAFFKQIGQAMVFNERAFKEFINYSSSHNSYSAYLGQQIGLYLGDSSLMDRGEVVLNFPFKDCVLEGGQSTEEGTDASFGFDADSKDYKETLTKRREVFYNEVLARDEIDQLFAPKAFTNARCYDGEGEHPVTDFHRDENGMITDNLLIKGNNLLALHSLQKEFAGRVKLIYIDPPYNTGNDSFVYNDNFNHSTWLTFMKNRLEIARELLKEDGVIFVSLDDKECHYCKVLMDSIFGRENFIADICHKARGSISNDKIISPNHNHILFYALNERYVFSKKEEYGISKDLSTFTEHDEVGYYKLVPVDGPGGAKKGNPHYSFLGITNYWRFSEERMQKMYDEGLIVKKGNSLMQKYYKSKAEKSRQTITTWWDDGYLTSSATSELKKVLWDGAFANPKNESLLELIIEFASKENDIILDFHLGSGTTAAVAHKLNRQYIGCEQIDYQVEISKTRLQKVISGEQGGISQSVHWQGGGSFVYPELAKKNEQAMELITSARSYDELVALFTTLSQRYFLHYNLNIKEFEERVMREDTFKALSLERQKEIFARMLDLNQMWVNRDEMNDEQFGLTPEDIVLTDNFYKQL